MKPEITKTVVAKKINHQEKDRIGLFFDYDRDTIKLPFAQFATFVTTPLFENETDIRIIRKLLLHSEIKTLMTYTHVSRKNYRNKIHLVHYLIEPHNFKNISINFVFLIAFFNCLGIFCSSIFVFFIFSMTSFSLISAKRCAKVLFPLSKMVR